MKLTDMTLKTYIDTLASDAPAPGGGSAAAVAGSQGVALFMMVANLTVGKAKYAEHEELCKTSLTNGQTLLAKMTGSIDEDTDAFNLLSAAFKLPKDTDEQKTTRSAQIAEATLVATQVPFDVMNLGLEGLREAANLIGKSNANAASDVGVAASNLLACVKGAWLNVKINLSGVKVAEKAEEFGTQGKRICEEAEKLANQIYEEILSAL